MGVKSGVKVNAAGLLLIAIADERGQVCCSYRWVQQQQAAAASSSRAAASSSRAASSGGSNTTHLPKTFFSGNPLWLRAAEKFKPLFGSKTIY